MLLEIIHQNFGVAEYLINLYREDKMGNSAANQGNNLVGQKKPDVTNQMPGIQPLQSLGGVGVGNQVTQAGPYGGMVTPDADNRGFTNADGGHDWNVGQGPGGNWNGEDQPTGLPPVGQDPGSGDALGIPRGTPQYRQATAAHKAWIQQNRQAGRTLADLGMSPVRGGGLSNYMEMAGTPRGVAGGTGIGTGTPGGNPTPMTSLGGFTGAPTKGTAVTTPTGPGFTTNNMVGNPVNHPANQTVANPISQPMTAQKRKQPPAMNSLGFNQVPMNTARLG